MNKMHSDRGQPRRFSLSMAYAGYSNGFSCILDHQRER